MSSLNGVTYICSAGLSSVTSAGALGPYFALTYFLPIYDFRVDKTICDTSALSISSLNYSTATHTSLSAYEIIYNNPELFGQGSYDIKNFNTMYSRGTSGTGPLFTGTRQRNGDSVVNVLNNRVLQTQTSATRFVNVAAGQLSAVGTYTTLNGASVNTWNPLSASSTNWNYQNLFRVTSYSPNQSTSGVASGNYKCRIPAGTGSFKFNMLAIYATRVNQYGYADPGVVGSPYNPTLFAVVVFDTPQIKSDTAGSLNAFEANIELQFSLASSAASPVYINTDYFTRIPTSNTTSAYALNYDGDVVISSSASPGSWVPRAKLTITDPEKDQVRLAYDDMRFTNIKTTRFKPYDNYPDWADMAVFDIDTSCPDDAILQLGYNCVATGIKSIAMGCYCSATGYANSGSSNYGDTNPSIYELYTTERGGYTLATGVETLAQGLISTTFGYRTSAIGFGSLAGGYQSVASSEGMDTTYYGSPSEGMNLAYGFKTSAISDVDSGLFPGGYSPSSLQNWFAGLLITGGNFATNIQTLAKGNGNTAFNINTISYGTGNNSFGMSTSALGILTIATGLSTLADGILSQSHGQHTSANAILSYVFGGYAQADVNAHGSFTFGSPYLYGGGVGSTTIYFPGYVKKIWDGSSEQQIPVSSSWDNIGQYTKTYNDGMGSFVFGQGTTVYSGAIQSFIAGINNITYSQGSTILGNKNTVQTGSASSSVVGGNNSIISSNFSTAIGFFNNINSSESSYIKGIYNNVTTTSTYSFVTGINNTISAAPETKVCGSDNNIISSNQTNVFGNRNGVNSSVNSSIFGNNNTIVGTYVVAFGNNNSIFNSVNSYSIGNSTSITNATNSVAIGYGASVNSSETVQIGSCWLTSASLVAKNIVLDAKACSTNNTRTKISLKADEIELEGYTGNIERYKYSLFIHRVRYDNNGSNTNDSYIVIKIFRARCDSYSGKIDSVSFKASSSRDGSIKTVETNTTVKTIITKLIQFVMFNPITMKFLYGDAADYANVNTYIANGYRMIAVSRTPSYTIEGLCRQMSADYYLFNDINKIDIYTTSNDEPTPSDDTIHGNYPGYDEQTFTSTITNNQFNILAQGRVGSGETDSKIKFVDRLNSTISASNYGETVTGRGKEFSCFNGIIGRSFGIGPYTTNVSSDDSLSVLRY